MFKKYNPKPICSYRSYKISDLRRIYKDQKLHAQTVRDWIKNDGLKAFLHEGDFYIYGAVLKEFLTNRNQKQKGKRSLDFKQFRCGYCKSKQPPLDNIITKLTVGFNKSLLAFGACGQCNRQIKRPYKRLELAKIKEIFKIQLDEVSRLCNSLSSTSKTDLNNDQKTGVSESLNKMINTRCNEANEVVKYQFFQELEGCGINDKDPREKDTVIQYVSAIHEFEVATNFKDFCKYDSTFGLEFKEHLSDKISKITGKNISKSIYVHYLKYAKELLEWLKKEKKEYSKITQKDINFLKTNPNDRNTALATGHQESNSVKDILATIRNMPETTLIEIRNKAMISLCLLTSPRIKALQTSRICSIRYFEEYEAWAFDQHPRIVTTKGRKHITSFFIGQSQDLDNNVLTWRKILQEKGFDGEDYLFPRIDSSFDSSGLSICELTKDQIASDSWIRLSIFKAAFEANNVKYLCPHSFRHSLARLARKQPDPTNLLIALSENDGHKNGMAVLISSYGGDYMADRSKLMKGFKLE